MRLHVFTQDTQGNQNSRYFDIGFLELLKHMVLAGSNLAKSNLALKLKSLGTFLQYRRYLDLSWRNFRGFNRLDPYSYDPGEIGELDRRLGLAVGDYLARRISNAKNTHTYEAAMLLKNLPLVGPRPDLFCDTGSSNFALEAKGYSVRSVSDNQMQVHKAQAGSGPLTVKFSVASVTYNIYNTIKCNYYDPINPEAEYDKELNASLRRHLYANALTFLQSLGEGREFTFNGLKFQSYTILTEQFGQLKFLFLEKAKSIIDGSLTEFEIPYFSEGDIYIDSDGLGVTA